MVPPNAALGWMEYTVAEAANYSKTAQETVLGSNI
jgi:hypothetical protein